MNQMVHYSMEALDEIYTFYSDDFGPWSDRGWNMVFIGVNETLDVF
jgi:hypothetical protein